MSQCPRDLQIAPFVFSFSCFSVLVFLVHFAFFCFLFLHSISGVEVALVLFWELHLGSQALPDTENFKLDLRLSDGVRIC